MPYLESLIKRILTCKMNSIVYTGQAGKKNDFAACEPQWPRPAYTSAQSDHDQHFCYSLMENIIDQYATCKISIF